MRHSLNKIFRMGLLIAFMPLLWGCPEGDVQKAPGKYSITVVDPNGKSAVGDATISGSGTFFVVVIDSSVGDFSFGGEISQDQMKVTYTDLSSKTVTVFLQFAPDRDGFNGTIQTTTGLFTVDAVRLGLVS